MKAGEIFIGGDWRHPVASETYQPINPANEEPLAAVGKGDERDIDLAVAAARKAFDEGPWPRMSAHERGRIVWRLGDLIQQNLDEMARLESLCTGKTLWGRPASSTSRSFRGAGNLRMSSRLATVSMSSAARGLGWQGGGGCSARVRRDVGSSFAWAGRVARPIVSKETQPMTAAADFVITSFDDRRVIFLPSRHLLLCGEPLLLVHYTGRPNPDWRAETLRGLLDGTLE